MLDTVPNAEQMAALTGAQLYEVWSKLCALIDESYDMERVWNTGGKAWTYEYKYRRGGKTLCALYARENCIGFMVILGKGERAKFEADRERYSEEVQRIYDEARTGGHLALRGFYGASEHQEKTEQEVKSAAGYPAAL